MVLTARIQNRYSKYPPLAGGGYFFVQFVPLVGQVVVDSSYSRLIERPPSC